MENGTICHEHKQGRFLLRIDGIRYLNVPYKEDEDMIVCSWCGDELGEKRTFIEFRDKDIQTMPLDVSYLHLDKQENGKLVIKVDGKWKDYYKTVSLKVGIGE